MKLKGKAAMLAAAAIIGSAGMVTDASVAEAAGGNCSATKQAYSNAYRARSICYSLSGGTRAKAWLIRNGGPDYYSG